MAAAPTSATSSNIPATSTAIKCRPNSSPPSRATCCGVRMPAAKTSSVAGGDRASRRLGRREHPADRHRQDAHDHDARDGRHQRLPTHAVVGRFALRLGEHEHEEERDQDRPGVDDHGRHGQELGAGEEEQSGRAQHRLAEPDRAVERIAERHGRRGRDDGDGRQDQEHAVGHPIAQAGHLRGAEPQGDGGQDDAHAAPRAVPRGSISHSPNAPSSVVKVRMW